MHRLLAVLVLAATLPLGACDGKYVTYTGTFPLSVNLDVREDGPFAERRALSRNDLVRAIADIPNDAEVLSAEVTSLSAEFDILGSTTASSVTANAFLEDLSGVRERVTVDKTFSIAVLQTTLLFMSASTQQSKLNDLRNSLNNYLKARNAEPPPPPPSVLIGIQGAPSSGRLDANITVNVNLAVTYRVCESIGGWLVAGGLGECTSSDIGAGG